MQCRINKQVKYSTKTVTTNWLYTPLPPKTSLTCRFHCQVLMIADIMKGSFQNNLYTKIMEMPRCKSIFRFNFCDISKMKNALNCKEIFQLVSSHLFIAYIYVYIYIVIHRLIFFVLSELFCVARHYIYIYIYIYIVRILIIKSNKLR